MHAAPAAAAPSARDLAAFFKPLGDETRLRIVALLSHGELCVCHVESALRLSQPHASRHLSVLRAAGIVEATRRGSWVHYRLARQEDPDRRRQLAALVRGFVALEHLREDVARLRTTRGPGACR